MIGPERPSHASSSHPQDGLPGPSAPRSGPQRPQPSQFPDAGDEDEDDYAPALPPELAAARATTTAKRVLGPAFPPGAGPARGHAHDDDDDDHDDEVGPQPLPQGYVQEEKGGVQEFLEREERRRKQLEEASKPQKLKRDEWMLVPPSASDLLGSIDPTKLNRPRQFARTAQPSRHADNSLWTETPAERQQRLADEVAGKRPRAEAADPTEDAAAAGPDARKRQKYDSDVRKGIEEHTAKHRGASLLKQHERSTSAKEAEKARNGDGDEPAAIWDRERDMSLGGRLMDDKTRDKFVREARGLGDRFGSGKSGGFL